jgi:fructokinase
MVVNILDPDVIVLGGGLSKIERNYRALHDGVARYALTDRLDTRIVPALHGDSSGVRGAAMLWRL